MNALLGIAPVATWTLENWVIAIIILAAVVGITYAALQYFGVALPSVFMRIVGIVLVAAFAIIAVRFLFTL